MLTVAQLTNLAHAALVRNQEQDTFDMYLHPTTFENILAITQGVDAISGHTAVIYGYRTFPDASVSPDAVDFRPRPQHDRRYE